MFDVLQGHPLPDPRLPSHHLGRRLHPTPRRGRRRSSSGHAPSALSLIIPLWTDVSAVRLLAYILALLPDRRAAIVALSYIH